MASYAGFAIMTPLAWWICGVLYALAGTSVAMLTAVVETLRSRSLDADEAARIVVLWPAFAVGIIVGWALRRGESKR